MRMPYVNHSIANSVKRMCENGNGRKCQKVNLHYRYFIIKLHSVIYNKLSASIYKPMLQYAWQKAECDIGSVILLFDVISVAFDIELLSCRGDAEMTVAMVKCAYCILSLCFDHLLANPHLHFEN